jgi:benzoate membrane transport protein
MSDSPANSATNWVTLTSASLTAVVVGFASTILVVMQGLAAVGATPAQQASAAAALCFGMAITSFFLSWRHRMPMITAWSTPGAVLLATSGGGVSYSEALGAFLAAGLLMCLTALIRPLSRAIANIPASIAAAMLAGVLLNYTLGVPAAALAMPLAVAPLVVLFFLMRLVNALYAVPAVVTAGIVIAALSGSLPADCCSVSLTPLEWVTPEFHLASIISLGLPLFLVTMASQNLPGFAVLRAAGYEPPVSSALFVTGAASALLAPFGSHALNMAAITASLVTGPDTHPDPQRRWLVAWPYLVQYALVGLGAVLFVQVLGGLPKPLVTAIAGLALFAPLMAGLAGMVREPREIEAALVTFLVTASGVSFHGIGAAFWGLALGLALWGLKRFTRK